VSAGIKSSSGRTAIDALASLFGVRIVNARWGPRGVFEALRRAKTGGLAPAFIFDIGASNGQWTQACRDIFPQARYLLVDPLEANRMALAAMAQSDARISVWWGAVGAAPGRLEIFEHGDQSSLLQSTDFPGTPRSVEVRTLDDLFESAGSPFPVLLKADVQGYEMEVLRGAERCLKSAEALILEVSYRKLYQDSALAHEIIAHVGARGFRIYDVCSYLQRPGDRELVQSDMVFVHQSSRLFAYEGYGVRTP
jgi:FkbM family methyltransferase